MGLPGPTAAVRCGGSGLPSQRPSPRPQPPSCAGLDSATTATVCSYLGKLCHVMQTTTVVSLLQPSGDVLALFDDIMLLADG